MKKKNIKHLYKHGTTWSVSPHLSAQDTETRDWTEQLPITAPAQGDCWAPSSASQATHQPRQQVKDAVHTGEVGCDAAFR